MRSFGKYITDEDLAIKRALAEELRNDPETFARVKAEASAKLADIPIMAKGVKASNGSTLKKVAVPVAAATAATAAVVAVTRRRRN